MRGFSLPEVALAMLIFAVGIGSMTEYFIALARGAQQQLGYFELWQITARQVEWQAPPPPAGWRVNRQETFYHGCVSINVTVTAPSGRHGQLARTHCASQGESGVTTDVKGLPF